jgi:hypothetical protein
MATTKKAAPAKKAAKQNKPNPAPKKKEAPVYDIGADLSQGISPGCRRTS